MGCENIFYQPASGECKIGDLGLSRKKDQIVKTMTGTPEFMAPEILDEQIDGYGVASDVYSFGITLLEIAVNKYPFIAVTNVMQVIKMKTILKEGPTELEELRKLIESTSDESEKKMRTDLVKAIDKCLEYNFTKRPNAKELQQYDFFKDPRIFDIVITGTNTKDNIVIKISLSSEQSVSRKISHAYEQKGDKGVEFENFDIKPDNRKGVDEIVEASHKNGFVHARDKVKLK